MFKKIFIIIKREYISRVKKKSFVVMTILGPILFAALITLPVIIAQMSDSDYEVGIVDDTDFFYDQLSDGNNVIFTHIPTNIDNALELLRKEKFDAVLHIPEVAFESPSTLQIFTKDAVNLNAKIHIENVLKQEFESLKLGAKGIDEDILRSIETNISIQSIRIQEDGMEETDYPEISMALGIISGILIYIFIFMFGSQVLRGVLEEKTSRIVEVIVSSVKPFQLMMGKIVGVGMVGLTQFLIWVFLTLVIVLSVSTAMPDMFQFTPDEQVHVTSSQMMNSEKLQEQMDTVQQHDTTAGQVLEALSAIKWHVMIFSFIFFFIGGYLLYGALFAAIGSAVDNEADTQQFMLPVTIPLIFAIIFGQMVMQNPSGPVAFWLSIIPLTSPVIMMIRIPFGIPLFDLYLSAFLLIAGFIFTTWMAAKIYRTGILLYGKKVGYKDIWKWIKYK